eukprot:5525838-Amphidinium_carterae.1
MHSTSLLLSGNQFPNIPVSVRVAYFWPRELTCALALFGLGYVQGMTFGLAVGIKRLMGRQDSIVALPAKAAFKAFGTKLKVLVAAEPPNVFL